MDGGSDAAAAAAATKVKPLTTAQRRRLKKKRAKAKARAEAAKKEAAAAEAASAGSAGVSTNGGGQHANGSSSGSSSAAAAAAGVEIEYVRADPLETAGEVDGDGTDEFAEEFRKQFGAIFEKFTTPQELMTGKAPKTEEELQVRRLCTHSLPLSLPPDAHKQFLPFPLSPSYRRKQRKQQPRRQQRRQLQ